MFNFSTYKPTGITISFTDNIIVIILYVDKVWGELAITTLNIISPNENRKVAPELVPDIRSARPYLISQTVFLPLVRICWNASLSHLIYSLPSATNSQTQLLWAPAPRKYWSSPTSRQLFTFSQNVPPPTLQPSTTSFAILFCGATLIWSQLD